MTKSANLEPLEYQELKKNFSENVKHLIDVLGLIAVRVELYPSTPKPYSPEPTHSPK